MVVGLNSAIWSSLKGHMLSNPFGNNRGADAVGGGRDRLTDLPTFPRLLFLFTAVSCSATAYFHTHFPLGIVVLRFGVRVRNHHAY